MTDNSLRQSDVLHELELIGYSFNSLWEFRDSKLKYRDAIPLLVSALERATDPKLTEQIVRALTVPWAKPLATRPLIEQFQTVDDTTGFGLRWTIGSALDVVWDDAHYDDLIALAREASYGAARQMLVMGIGRSKKPEAVDVLIELLDDPDVSGHAVIALRKLRATKARPHLEKMLHDKRAWVRKEVQRALTALA